MLLKRFCMLLECFCMLLEYFCVLLEYFCVLLEYFCVLLEYFCMLLLRFSDSFQFRPQGSYYGVSNTLFIWGQSGILLRIWFMLM